jgi:predicted nucleic acid-binding protein
MTILDTSVTIDRIRSRKPIDEDITAVTFIEYPRIVYYNTLWKGDISSKD